MRANARERETFIASLLKQVPTATRADALRLLRWGATYGRLCEAECSIEVHDPCHYFRVCDPGPMQTGCGESMAANAEGMTQKLRTSKHWPSVTCWGCLAFRAERIIRETCESMMDTPPARDRGEGYRYPPKIVPHFQGDPRGFTVRLAIAGAPLDAYERAALAVPTS